MADIAGLGSFMPKISGTQLLNGLMYFMIAVIIIGLIGFFTWYFMHRKKYSQYRVEIFDKDTNGNVYKTYDRGGIFLDKKTGYRLFFLEKAKWGGNPNNVPYIAIVEYFV